MFRTFVDFVLFRERFPDCVEDGLLDVCKQV